MISDLVRIINKYPVWVAICRRKNVAVSDAIDRLMRRYDREPDSPPTQEGLDYATIRKSERITNEEARAIYKELSQHFARQRMRSKRKEDRASAAKKIARVAAAARWSKKDSGDAQD